LVKEVGALIKRLIGIFLLIVLLGIVVYSHFYPVYEISEETKDTGANLPQTEYEFYEGEEFGRHGDILIREDQTLNNEGIDKDSTITGVKLVSLKEDKGLLNAHIRLFYGEATLDMSHRLDYVYFGTQPYLFIYSEGGGV